MATVLQQYSGSASGIVPFGIILGSAINQAGRSSGLTAPNGPSQSALISTALAVAGVSSADVRFVSVHGTGTALGDPIEIGALATALPAHAQQSYRGPLTLASNKSCYGHTEGAAGLTGLLVAVCMAGQQTAPAIMHLRTINPYVAAAVADWGGQGGKPLHLPRQLASGGGSSGQQGGVAGTSSFGMSGVNAHMLVRAAPQGRDSVVPQSVSAKRTAQHASCLHTLVVLSQPSTIHLDCRPPCHLSAPATSVPQLCTHCWYLRTRATLAVQ